MALHECPECEIAMESKAYEDVLIDVCPSCRGVWLDRGELQKIIAHVRREENEAWSSPELDLGRSAPAAQTAPPPREEPRESKKKRKKKGFGEIWDVIESFID
jgi:Zn-finger nucleic acid-binding protein